jgi:hypothetical protein
MLNKILHRSNCIAKSSHNLKYIGANDPLEKKYFSVFSIFRLFVFSKFKNSHDVMQNITEDLLICLEFRIRHS